MIIIETVELTQRIVITVTSVLKCTSELLGVVQTFCSNMVIPIWYNHIIFWYYQKVFQTFIVSSEYLILNLEEYDPTSPE